MEDENPILVMRNPRPATSTGWQRIFKYISRKETQISIGFCFNDLEICNKTKMLRTEMRTKLEYKIAI
uniref:Uncharacterized protein n=1 Tax=Heterorhabditis bacteriophora TaxID=37862 RepID=A0A1I7XWD4_HETBA